jgi:hypothetical protein
MRGRAEQRGLDMPQFAQWVASLPISLWARQITWLVPMMQTLHILSIGAILSAVVMIDMRIWGVSRSQGLAERANRFLPWIWVALIVSTLTGIALMVGSPRSMRDAAFLAKVYMMAAATVLTIVLPFMLRWNSGYGQKDAGALANFVGTTAFLLWLGVTFAGRGRWIAGLFGV